jgi:ABC-2 type transport system permease protein
LLVSGRSLAGLGVVVIQLVVIGVVAAIMGWSPRAAGIPWAVLLVVLGALSFGMLGVLLGGALKAEIVLALANIVWFILLLGGGVLFPASKMPGAAGVVVQLLPSGALAEGLRAALVDGAAPGWGVFAVLIVWGAGAGALASRTTKLS